MGQRHQMFVIARVQGRYRCIAAFHSQWLYGQMVVKAAARLIRAFVNPINAAAIAGELATLEELDISAIARKDNGDLENPDVLCPYLTGLFLTCSRLDMEEGRFYRMNIEDMHYPPSACDNDDGYTCFDLTEAGSPRYCFLWWGTEPLTAFEYLRSEQDKQLDPAIYGILGHCPLLELETLAEVWPRDFRGLLEQRQPGEGQSGQTSDAPVPLHSPESVYSAASALDAIRMTSLDLTSEAVTSEIAGLLMIIFLHLGHDGILRLLERAGASLPSDSPSLLPSSSTSEAIPSDPSSLESHSAISAAFAEAREMRSANPDLGWEEIAETVLGLPGNLRVLREELLGAKTLGPDDLRRLKHLIAAEQNAIVDFKPWFSTGALDAAMLLDISDALQHAEALDLSLSSTLTAEIVEALVSRLPNLRHIIAFNCERLLPLTTALPITSYLTSLPVVDAIDQTRWSEGYDESTPECLRWVEESDPPAGLTVVLYSPSLSPYSTEQTPVRRYGLEISHFGAEGVIRGFSRYLERLYQPHFTPTLSGCYFEMRAYFHSTGSLPLRQCIITSHSASPSYSFGCLPSLIRDASPDDGQPYPAMTSTTASGAVTGVPRHPGWVLALDTKGTMPYHRSIRLVDIREFLGIPSFLNWASAASPTLDGVLSVSSADASSLFQHEQSNSDGASAASSQESEDGASTPRDSLPLPEHASSPDEATTSSMTDGASPPSPQPNDAIRPEYAFERWDLVPGQTTKELRVVERVSVREWVNRLPAGHGAVPEALLAECEAVLARLNVALRGSPDEPGLVTTD